MAIENSGDFGIFEVFGVCLELQRGQVGLCNEKIEKYMEWVVCRINKNIIQTIRIR